MLLVDDLMHQDAAQPGDLLCLLAVAAASLQFDVCSRPSETLSLRADMVIPPQGRKYPRWAIIFHPGIPLSADPDGLLPAVARPTSHLALPKSGSMDDTVYANMDGSSDGTCARVLAALIKANDSHERLLHPLAPNAYEKITAASVKRCGVQKLDIVPHALRHGGASAARQENFPTVCRACVYTRSRLRGATARSGSSSDRWRFWDLLDA